MILATVALLHVCLSATATTSAEGSAETLLKVAPGAIAVLPCYRAGDVTPNLTTWMKNGQEIVAGGGSSRASPNGQRLAVLQNGTLSIAGVTAGDEGSYLCNTTLPDNSTFWARVRLRVTGVLGNLTTSIGPTTALSNGTLVAFRDSNVSFNCSASSGSPQQLVWAFKGATASNESLVSTSGSSLDFRINAIEPSHQGVYSCRALDTVTQQAVNESTQLLVYYVSDRHPECMWAPALDPSHIHFNCTWLEVYPTPKLSWVDKQGDDRSGQKGHIYVSEETNSLSVMLNRSMLSDGQTLSCVAQHVVLPPGKERSCSFTIKAPFPEGEPLAVAQEGDSITLTCTEGLSTPPATTTWRKGLQQEDIVPGVKYVVTEEGPVFKLTIYNISKDDEGVYFCRSENLLGIRELEVYLTVRTSSAYTGVIIGIFIAALIVGSSITLAKLLYSNRQRICLGDGFRQEDRGDVMNLVESDDEQIFQDVVPQLPPLTHERQTTLVQIHQIPSSDHEDLETPNTSREQQDETVPTDEPEDLLTL